ncbi:MAG: Nif3-like dinuclear metal center hexameric protein [Methylophilaceae bacterium]
MINIKELVHYNQQLLQVERFKDYCPNGLQVEGRAEIQKIVSGVTASMALLEAAYDEKADLILVHHGYFWKNEESRIIGIKRQRLAFLLQNNLNLMAYHLPLDAHVELGNNAQLGRVLGLVPLGYTGENSLMAFAELPQASTLQHFATHVEFKLQRSPLVLGDRHKKIQKIAWCTGAAQDYMEEAIALGADVFISGEVSEQTTHLAQESGVAYIAAGHHATERYGVQALGAHLAEKFNLQHLFIEIKNPV